MGDENSSELEQSNLKVSPLLQSAIDQVDEKRDSSEIGSRTLSGYRSGLFEKIQGSPLLKRWSLSKLKGFTSSDQFDRSKIELNQSKTSNSNVKHLSKKPSDENRSSIGRENLAVSTSRSGNAELYSQENVQAKTLTNKSQDPIKIKKKLTPTTFKKVESYSNVYGSFGMSKFNTRDQIDKHVESKPVGEILSNVYSTSSMKKKKKNYKIKRVPNKVHLPRVRSAPTLSANSPPEMPKKMLVLVGKQKSRFFKVAGKSVKENLINKDSDEEADRNNRLRCIVENDFMSNLFSYHAQYKADNPQLLPSAPSLTFNQDYSEIHCQLEKLIIGDDAFNTICKESRSYLISLLDNTKSFNLFLDDSVEVLYNNLSTLFPIIANSPFFRPVDAFFNSFTSEELAYSPEMIGLYLMESNLKKKDKGYQELKRLKSSLTIKKSYREDLRLYRTLDVQISPYIYDPFDFVQISEVKSASCLSEMLLENLSCLENIFDANKMRSKGFSSNFANQLGNAEVMNLTENKKNIPDKSTTLSSSKLDSFMKLKSNRKTLPLEPQILCFKKEGNMIYTSPIAEEPTIPNYQNHPLHVLTRNAIQSTRMPFMMEHLLDLKNSN